MMETHQLRDFYVIPEADHLLAARQSFRAKKAEFSSETWHHRIETLWLRPVEGCQLKFVHDARVVNAVHTKRNIESTIS